MPPQSTLMQQIVQFLGITGTAATLILASGAIAYGFFRFLGSKWIESKFKESLKEFEHRQEVELVKLKAKIDVQFDRARKANDKEYTILPEAWKIMLNAIAEISRFASPMKWHLDLRHFNENEIRIQLSEDGYAEWKIDRIFRSSDRQKELKQTTFEFEGIKAGKALNDFSDYILFNSIFLSSSYREKFFTIRNKLREVFYSYSSLEDNRHKPEEYDKRERLLKEVEDTKLSIENEIHNALSTSSTSAL